jgi:membrane protein DedA with SNARE-associated domain
VQRFVTRHPNFSIVGVRFAYGLRIAGPLLIGTTAVPARRFAALNALGAIAWAGLLATLGWTFGEVATALLGELRHIEGWLFLGGLLLGAGAWVLQHLRGR